MPDTYYGPWRGYNRGNRGRFVVRNDKRYYEFSVKPGQIQLSIDAKFIEQMQNDEWDYDISLRNRRVSRIGGA